MINKYKKFLERIDDDAWSPSEFDLNNDDIPSEHNFRDYESSNLYEFDPYDTFDNYDDDYYGGRHAYRKPKDEDDDIEPSVEDDDMENLKYLLRKMFRNRGIKNVTIVNDDLDLTIRCNLSYREKLSDLIALFDVVNKLKTDILAQYDTEFDTWENQTGQTFEFGFYYGDGLSDDTDEDFGEDDQVPF